MRNWVWGGPPRIELTVVRNASALERRIALPFAATWWHIERMPDELVREMYLATQGNTMPRSRLNRRVMLPALEREVGAGRLLAWPRPEEHEQANDVSIRARRAVVRRAPSRPPPKPSAQINKLAPKATAPLHASAAKAVGKAAQTAPRAAGEQFGPPPPPAEQFGPPPAPAEQFGPPAPPLGSDVFSSSNVVEKPGKGRVPHRHAPKELVGISSPGNVKRVQLEATTAAAYSLLVEHARRDGFSAPLFLVVSGYRDQVKQAQLYRDALKKYGTPEEARKWVAPPGKSAHGTGCAVDLWLGYSCSSENNGKIKGSAAYAWLRAHAKEHGFNPYEREGWHWEYYVG
jgi:hypothetical protein